MEIRPLTSSTPGPQGLDALAATAAPAPPQGGLTSESPSPPLEPAVKLDIGTGGTDKARYIQDRDTSKIVFQVVDSTSGEVVEQLPSENALRNRAYDSARGTQAAQARSLTRVA